ncbi:MAG TPA: hypothetical protein VL494_13870 [Steroidobacteraceae bacterium]|nr:hypothetical protein [Steroidobacteraceae bacterium]
MRATPSAGIEAQRSQTPVSGQPAQPLPPPSLHPAEAQAAAYKRRAEEAEKQLAEQRAAKASEAPASGNAVLSDEHIGRFVREVTRVFLRRIGAPAALVAMLGGGGYALKASHDKPAPPPLTAQQLDERLEKFEGKVVSRLDKLTTTTNEGIDLQRCLRKKVGQIGGSLLPAVDRMGAALKQQPFDDDCPDSPKRLPEPKPQ